MVVVPSPITGSIGSRIRVVLGENGNEWLLLLNHDNGSTTWQVKDWSSIPNAVAKQINNCTNKGRNVTDVDFNSNGGWIVQGEKTDGSGGHCWWGGLTPSTSATVKENTKNNSKVSLGTTSFHTETHAIILGRNGYSLSGGLHQDFENRLKKTNSRNKTINFVRLFHNGQFYLSDADGNLFLFHNNEHLSKELLKNKKIEDVALAVDGSWVVIFDNTFEVSTGVDKKLTKALSKFYSDQRKYIQDRRQEIREANAANERERVAREQAAQEAREAAEREAREAREAAEREEREAAEREERERIRREAERAESERAAAAAQLNAADRISSLEATLEKRLIEEAQDIKDSETKLQNRKRSFREAMQSMPAETQARITLDDTNTSGNDSNTCVICHDDTSVMAVSPCGHVCLCNSCADICMSGQNGRPSCPLCRGDMQSVLRVYWGSN